MSFALHRDTETMQHHLSTYQPVLLPLLLSLQLLSGRQDVLHQVSGILNQSVCLSHQLDFLVERIVWELEHNGSAFKLAEYEDQSLITLNSRFSNRLESSNAGTALRITKLKIEDSKIYKAIITLRNADIRTVYFNLTVYEPVPDPTLSAHVEKDKTWCNVTLHCSVPTNVSLIFYIWMYRNGSSGYQHYTNGTTIHLLLMDIPQNMEFLCLVKNPAEQKNVSAHVEQICEHVNAAAVDNSCWIKLHVYLPILAILSVAMLLVARL
ncbi:SLAM family member 9 [Xenopus laevis]|uniref:Ig-like domain-containing protein n=2 Tax=Xenopus laevis TaxID=8355 RepID=A0A974H937_XENLA|nr:SLAM family member 9 [Xenopus laevis]OCT69155.1 hypothetical protein XELAEV_18040464mg [Xenopus laevis]